jgi:hypothetical protein
MLEAPGCCAGFAALAAGLDEGLLAKSLSDLLYIGNPYSGKRFQ